VKDQGQCGSCWAFSTVGLLESTNVIFNKVPVVSFSEQQLVDCSGAYNNFGCNGGMPSSAVNYVVNNGGITTEAEYPYTAVDGTCNTNVTLAFDPSPSVAVPNNVAAFKAALNIQPISICVDASKWYKYSSGVFHNCSSSPSKLDHAVVLVGYESNGDWIVRNSWGTSWGNAGYITLRNGNTCGVLNYGIITGV
jgi:cathepsin L